MPKPVLLHFLLASARVALEMLSWPQLRHEEPGSGGPGRSTGTGVWGLSLSPGCAAALVCNPRRVSRPLAQDLHSTVSVSETPSSSEQALLLGAPRKDASDPGCPL